MPDFPYFIFWLTTIFFVIAFYAFLFVVWLMGGIPRSMWSIPQYKFMIIGTLTTLKGIFMLFSNSHVPGVMQALLGPTVVTIPMAMGCSFLLLKSRYAWKQVGAVVLIMASLFIALCPSFFGTGHKDTGNVGWNFCFLFGSLPLTIATVYQEKVFEDVPIHMAYMLAWGSLYSHDELECEGKRRNPSLHTTMEHWPFSSLE
ncbi:hypothetical protein QOT17_002790 [Balamuthia mandrillaris]